MIRITLASDSAVTIARLLPSKILMLLEGEEEGSLVAHDCGYPLSRYTCRATRVAADFLDFIAFCRCSTGVALHPLNILVSHLPPPPVPGGVAPKFGSEKVSRYTGVSQLQLRVSRYTVQLRKGDALHAREDQGEYYPNTFRILPATL